MPPPPKSDFIFGTRAVIEAINAEREIDRVLVQKGLRNELTQELLTLTRAQHVPVSFVPTEKLNRVTRKNHQGVVAFVSSVTYASLDNIINRCFSEAKDPLLVLLDRVTDVRNFGAIARTAECLGAHALVVPAQGNARIGADAMKTSAGALNHLPVCRVTSLKDTVQFLKNSGIRVVACTEKTGQLLSQTDLRGPVALLLGSEEDGISDELLRQADELVVIPMAGNVASLNVSVAAAISLYEVVRQRNN
jgi:23S rRNA (guanosine2251-2'-O)-methyltransferase